VNKKKESDVGESWAKNNLKKILGSWWYRGTTVGWLEEGWPKNRAERHTTLAKKKNNAKVRTERQSGAEAGRGKTSKRRELRGGGGNPLEEENASSERKIGNATGGNRAEKKKRTGGRLQTKLYGDHTRSREQTGEWVDSGWEASLNRRGLKSRSMGTLGKKRKKTKRGFKTNHRAQKGGTPPAE